MLTTWDEPELTPEQHAEALMVGLRRVYENCGRGYTPPRIYVSREQAEALRRVSGYEVVALHGR